MLILLIFRRETFHFFLYLLVETKSFLRKLKLWNQYSSRLYLNIHHISYFLRILESLRNISKYFPYLFFSQKRIISSHKTRPIRIFYLMTGTKRHNNILRCFIIFFYVIRILSKNKRNRIFLSKLYQFFCD